MPTPPQSHFLLWWPQHTCDLASSYSDCSTDTLSSLSYLIAHTLPRQIFPLPLTSPLPVLTTPHCQPGLWCERTGPCRGLLTDVLSQMPPKYFRSSLYPGGLIIHPFHLPNTNSLEFPNPKSDLSTAYATFV